MFEQVKKLCLFKDAEEEKVEAECFFFTKCLEIFLQDLETAIHDGGLKYHFFQILSKIKSWEETLMILILMVNLREIICV